MPRRPRKRRQPTGIPASSWLAACWGWLIDLLVRKPRKGVAKDAAATGTVGELLDRALDNVDGC